VRLGLSDYQQLEQAIGLEGRGEMRKVLSLAGLIAVLSSAAMAQDIPSAELASGYSYLRAEGGAGFHGWNESLAVNLNRWGWIGLVAEFGGHYGSERQPASLGGFTFDVRNRLQAHTILGGVRFSYRDNDRVTPFVHNLFGASFGNINTRRVSLPGSPLSFPQKETSFAMAIGGGFDINLSRRVAFRAVQADYFLTRFNNSSQTNARLTTGIVIRFY
jgi:opacity protein-like surface antigen